MKLQWINWKTLHEKDTDFVNNPSKNYKWSDEASKIVAQGVKNNAKPT